MQLFRTLVPPRLSWLDVTHKYLYISHLIYKHHLQRPVVIVPSLLSPHEDWAELRHDVILLLADAQFLLSFLLVGSSIETPIFGCRYIRPYEFRRGTRPAAWPDRFDSAWHWRVNRRRYIRRYWHCCSRCWSRSVVVNRFPIFFVCLSEQNLYSVLNLSFSDM